jgi:hypothetical protein
MARLLVLTVLGNAPIAWSAEPPPPDPQHPVDYVAWVNAEFTRDLVDNAADLYRSASAAPRSDRQLSALAGIPACTWSPLQRGQIEDCIQRNAAALDEVAGAAAKKRCYFELYSENGSLIGAQLRASPDMPALTRMLALRAQLRLAGGDVECAVDDALTLLAIARHLESQPTLLAYHRGCAVRALAYSLLLEVPRAPAQNADFWAILKRVEDADRGPSKPKPQYVFERILAWDAAQRVLKDRAGNGLYTIEGTRARPPGEMTRKGSPPPERTSVFGPWTWDQVMQDIHQYFDDLDKVTDMNYPQALDAAAQLAERVRSAEDSFMKTMSPHRTRALLECARATAHYRGSLLVVRLHAYRALHAHWPVDLQSMLPVRQQVLAIDPFSDQPFVYRLENGEPHLYSVSENRVDDGREVCLPPRVPRWDQTGDYVFWPRPRCP